MRDQREGGYASNTQAPIHDLREWREALLCRIRNAPHTLPGRVATFVRPQLDKQLREAESALRSVARELASHHGTPDLGNKEDPVDELIYIILSRKTRESAYKQAFDRLKVEFTTWDELLAAPRRRVANLVHSGGLASKKTDSIYRSLGRLWEKFGTCTLEPARLWSDDELHSFLCSIPEVGPKSAYCIMMYSFGRSVLPVDTHVGRCLTRLAPYRKLGIDLRQLGHKKLQAVLPDLIPPDLRYSLHVNLVVHGRTICRMRRPLCNRCPILDLCAHGLGLQKDQAAG